MPTGRPAGLSIDAFVKLMAEMGVEAVPLPDSEQETVDAEATQAGSDRRVAWGRRLRKMASMLMFLAANSVFEQRGCHGLGYGSRCSPCRLSV